MKSLVSIKAVVMAAKVMISIDWYEVGLNMLPCRSDRGVAANRA